MLNLIVVDDYPLEGAAIKHILQKNRPNINFVGQAMSGHDCFEIVKKIKVHIAIVDINMPNMNGITLSKILHEQYPNIKVIILSAYDNFEMVQQALRVGVCDYCLKPMNPVEFLSVVDKATSYKKNEVTFTAPTSCNAILAKCNELFAKAYHGSTQNLTEDIQEIWMDLKALSEDDSTMLGAHTIKIASSFLYYINQAEIPSNICQKAYTVFIASALSIPLDVSEMEVNFTDFTKGCVEIVAQCYIDPNFKQVTRVKDIVSRRIDACEEVSLKTVAEEVFLSPSYLSRTFKRKAGINFVDYIMEQRIEKAKLLLLTTNQSIETISEMVGYNQPNSFRRLFKQKVGLTPTEYIVYRQKEQTTK